MKYENSNLSLLFQGSALCTGHLHLHMSYKISSLTSAKGSLGLNGWCNEPRIYQKSTAWSGGTSTHDHGVTFHVSKFSLVTFQSCFIVFIKPTNYLINYPKNSKIAFISIVLESYWFLFFLVQCECVEMQLILYMNLKSWSLNLFILTSF